VDTGSSEEAEEMDFREKFHSPKKMLTRDGQYFNPPAGVTITLSLDSKPNNLHHTHDPTAILTLLQHRQASRLARPPRELL